MHAVQKALESDKVQIVEFSGSVKDVKYTDVDYPEGLQWYEARIKRIPQPIQGEKAVAVINVNITSRKRLEFELKKMAETDQLTGVYNRRYFIEHIDRQFKHFQRYGENVSLMMFDIDFFKKVNDTYGHLVGDEVLKFFARTAAKSFREADVFARYGGEEFVALMPDTDENGAYRMAERIRATIERSELNIKGKKIKFTVSGGIASMRKEDHSFNDALNRSDEALYKAKNSGRNRIVICRDM